MELAFWGFDCRAASYAGPVTAPFYAATAMAQGFKCLFDEYVWSLI